ncbi:MAG: hypothetical protein R3C39_11955 [Dehalococcoidia bacterium]
MRLFQHSATWRAGLRASALVIVAGVMLAFVACSDDSDEGEPTPSDRTETGIEAVDDTIEAVLANDVEALNDLIAYREEPCLAPEQMGLGGLPCEEGEAAGTPISAFPAAACEGYWVREGAIDGLVSGFLDQTESLFAVVEGPEGDQPDSFPLGDQRVIFAGSVNGQPAGFLAVIEDGHVVSLQTSCGTGPEGYLTYRDQTLPLILGTAAD